MNSSKIAGVVVASLIALTGASRAETTPYAPPEGLKVQVVKQGDGWVIADEKGVTLYTSEADEAEPGKSSCGPGCAEQWPPLLAAADAKPQGAWSLIPREDGKKQWAVRGRPLYYYNEEGGPGTTFGDGEANNQWRRALIPIWTPPGVSVGKTLIGTALVDGNGVPFYTHDGDTLTKSSCTGSCLDYFQPVAAPGLANANGDWSVVTRADRTKQWAYKGAPLYRCALDVKAGETNCDGAGADEGWRVSVLQPPAPMPSWVTVQYSLGGELYADAKGITIYYHGTQRRSLLNLTVAQAENARRLAASRAAGPCQSADCMGEDWKAVIADAQAKPVGDWTIIDNKKDGTKQWAFKGQRLYTTALDTRPGEFRGIRFGGDRAWKTLMRSGKPLDNM